MSSNEVPVEFQTGLFNKGYLENTHAFWGHACLLKTMKTCTGVKTTDE